MFPAFLPFHLKASLIAHEMELHHISDTPDLESCGRKGASRVNTERKLRYVTRPDPRGGGSKVRVSGSHRVVCSLVGI